MYINKFVQTKIFNLIVGNNSSLTSTKSNITLLLTSQAQEVLGMRGCVENNSSLTLTKSNFTLEYTTEG